MGQKPSRADAYLLLDDMETPEENAENSKTEIKVYRERKSSSVGLPILFYGTPRSGKSYIANELTEELKNLYVDGYTGPRFQIIPMEVRANLDSFLADNEYRFTAICYLVDISLYYHGTKDDNPILRALKEVQRVANQNRLRHIPIMVMLTRKALLQEKMKTHPPKANFPDYYGGDNVNEFMNFIREKFKFIRQITYRNKYHRSFYVFPPDSYLALALVTIFYRDHLIKSLVEMGYMYPEPGNTCSRIECKL